MKRSESRQIRAATPLIAAVLALTLAACGGDDDGGDGSAERETPPTTQEAVPTQTDTTGEADAGEEEQDGAGGGLPSGNANAGEQVFSENCASCHGPDGGGTGTAPSLQESDLAENRDEVVDQVVNGGGGMPPFGDQLSDQQIADVAAFVTETVAQR